MSYTYLHNTKWHVFVITIIVVIDVFEMMCFTVSSQNSSIVGKQKKIVKYSQIRKKVFYVGHCHTRERNNITFPGTPGL